MYNLDPAKCSVLTEDCADQIWTVFSPVDMVFDVIFARIVSVCSITAGWQLFLAQIIVDIVSHHLTQADVSLMPSNTISLILLALL